MFAKCLCEQTRYSSKGYRHKKEQNKITLGATPSLQDIRFSKGEDRGFVAQNYEHASVVIVYDPLPCIWTRFGTLRSL